MGQSINWSGLAGALGVLVRPSLVVPHLVVADIRQLPVAKLREAGFCAIAFDKDNTLTAPYAMEIHPPFQDAWTRCLDAFGPSNVAIVSNSAGGPDDAGHAEATRIEQALGVHVLRHAQKKPAGGQALAAHFGCAPRQIVVVGDRLFTDVLYANRMGAYSVLTRGIVTETNDNWLALRIRRMEHRLLDLLLAAKVQPPYSLK
ncbi:mitochondrial PGP phosphatase-domain-containing protein [Entophlyctis helioformis]|nr:mitochondrial PGP phosphatase-domain-containing protein [Entophlyctis helioformis]